MPEDTDGMKTVQDLIGKHFFIPDYQRGYRWTQVEVNALLNDLWGFFTKERHQNRTDRNSFYCLQPVVVRKMTPQDIAARDLSSADWWEVIDGQQRLTTLFLLLMYAWEEVSSYLFYPGEDSLNEDYPFYIRYETRERSEEKLQNITTMSPDDANENIDFLHFYYAFQAIKNWFHQNMKLIPEKMKMRADFLGFLVAEREQPHIRVIWYQLPKEESPKSVFMRLNTGKIPLSNVELIRALFLQSTQQDSAQTTSSQLELAHKWDTIEKKLQDNRLWYFLRNSASETIKRFDSRIEILFILYNTLVLSTDSDGRIVVDRNDLKNNYHTFVKFNQIFTEKGGAQWVWPEISSTFDVLEEWYEDYTLYHLIGLLLEMVDEPLDEIIYLMDQQRRLTHSEFESSIKDSIWRKLHGKKIPSSVTSWLKEIGYGSTNRSILRHTLLAFNIATLLEKRTENKTQDAHQLQELRYLRFPFFRYKVGKWDIEHIHSVHSEVPTRKEDIVAWLYLHLTELETMLSSSSLQWSRSLYNSLIQKEQTLTQDIRQDFESLYLALIREFSGEQEEDNDDKDINSIGNLTLLRPQINRSFGNALFPVKRKVIIHEDKKGIFSPLCTTNVFLKYYSKNVQHVVQWTAKDIHDYEHEICKTLSHFFS